MSTPKTDIFRDRDINAKDQFQATGVMIDMLDSHEQLETEAERLREALMQISKYPQTRDAELSVSGLREIARAALEPK